MTDIKPEHLAEAKKLALIARTGHATVKMSGYIVGTQEIAAAFQRLSDAKDAALTAHGAEQFEAGRVAGLEEFVPPMIFDTDTPQDVYDRWSACIAALKTQKQGAKG